VGRYYRAQPIGATRAGYNNAIGDTPYPASNSESVMKKAFKVGDYVSWNSEAGRVSGTIVKVHTKNVNYKGYTHHASRDNPQYEIESDKTDHVALHKGSALRRL
jgi:hypothetical protein